MKKALIIMVVMLIPAMTLAENPDSRPSITVGLSGGMSTLDHEVIGLNQDGDDEYIGFGAGLKWPVSKNATINFSGRFHTGNTEWKMYYLAPPSKVDYNGFKFNFSVTLYIGKSINK